MKRPIIKAAVVAVASAVLGGSLSGCSSSPAAQTLFCFGDAKKQQVPGETHAILVIGNVANAPAWTLTDQIITALTNVLQAHGRVDLVSTAGDGYLCPAERLGMETFTDDINQSAKDDAVSRNLKRIRKEITRAPRDNGSDAYAAIHLAADEFDSIGGQERLLLFLGSGLNDHGLLDYTRGLLGSDPDEVVSYLKKQGPLPRLSNTTTILAGLGWTAPIQEPLNDRQRGNVENTYKAILAASGAAVTIDPAPINTDPIDPLGKTVEPTPLPPEPTVPPTGSCKPFEEVFDQTSALQFKGDRAEFVDPTAARAALAPIADWLKEDPAARQVSILGTTARAGSKAYQKDLALKRAKAAQRLLLDLGVKPGQITKVNGAGSWFDGYLDDRGPAGGLLPGPAAKNRSVRLTLHQAC